MRLIYTTIAAVLLSSLAASATEPWWDMRWDHRCALRIAAAGAPIEAPPIILRGQQLQCLADGASMPPASVRIVRDGCEIPCQYDAFTDGGLQPTRPPVTPDADDELVFQVDLSANGGATYWLYWNSTPLPPGDYSSRSLIGDAMEPAAWHHDYQLWNDQCFACMRGPSRSQTPAENKQENYGGGTDELLWYAQAGDVKTFRPTAEQLEETRETKKVILNTGGIKPWMAGYAVEERKGYVVVFDATAPTGAEHPSSVSGDASRRIHAAA